MNTTPLINPLWFYLFEIVESLDSFFYVAIFILGFISIGGVFSGLVGLYDNYKMDEKAIKIGKRLIKPIIFLVVLMVFLPSEETCYKMLAANYVTPANIKAVGDTAADVTTFIADTIEDIINKEDAK